MISNPRLRPVGIGHSFFEFIGEFCLDEKENRSINRAFHRLCTLMRKMDAKTAIIEDIAPTYSDMNAESTAITTYYGKDIEIKAYRFTFVSEEITSLKSIQKLDPGAFLSSAIIVNFKLPDGNNWKSYLYSAIVAIPKISNHKKYGSVPLLNNYLHIYKTFPCEVSIADGEIFRFNLTGTFFCQQNSVTSVCAHASLCMTINNMNLEGVGIISPESINKIIEVDHKSVKFSPYPGKEGLSKDEILSVLKKYGLTLTWSDFFENPNVEYNDYIYKYIESQCPVLLVFSTAGTSAHIVPILGHTLNSDMWRPEAEPAYAESGNRLNYKPASAWVDHFIIHDDNFGMYFCLPVEALKRVTLPKYDPAFRAHFAVVVIPSGVTTPAWEAECASIVIVKHILQLSANSAPIDKWSDRILTSDPARRPIIVRTLLTEKDAYLKSLTQKDFEGNEFTEQDKTELIKDLPERFWLSEITLPDLYTANKTKIVDFFYKADCPTLAKEEDIFERWLQVRFPYALLKRNKDGSASMVQMSIKSHYPLLRLEREHDILDW